MADMIQTQWHRACEAVLHGEVAIHAGTRKKDHPGYDPNAATYNPHGLKITEATLQHMSDFMQLADRLPKFYLDRNLTELLSKQEATKSLQAMYEAGLAKLPFPELVVEWDRKKGEDQWDRYICVLSERDEDSKMPEEDGFHPWSAMLLRIRMLGGVARTVFSPSLIVVRFDPVAGEEKEFGFHYAARPAPFFSGKTPQAIFDYMTSTLEVEAVAIGEALAAVVLLMHTKGVKKELISVPKLNKNRLRKDLPLIPDVTTLSIGSVFTKEGKEVAYSYGPRTGERKPQRVHWRRGHNRLVWYGPKKQLSKINYIEPCLVNYVGNIEEAPVAKFRVTK